MTTKNLARTIIEGGRCNGYERRLSNRMARAGARQASLLARRLNDYDEALYEPRTPVGRCFDDKLHPALRWLRSHVGRPWHKVRSDLFQRFDARTTAGRHILFDHLLEEVLPYSSVPQWPYHYPFKVDAHGILREQTSRWRSPWPTKEPLPEPEKTLLAWLANRRVGAHGARLYWYTPTRAGKFRQERALAEQDAARWHALPTWFQELHDPRAPVRTDAS